MVKIYHNPRCSKSRQALDLLKQNNIVDVECDRKDTANKWNDKFKVNTQINTSCHSYRSRLLYRTCIVLLCCNCPAATSLFIPNGAGSVLFLSNAQPARTVTVVVLE